MTIPVCKECGRDAMPNTLECIDHHNARLDNLWAARWARYEALPFEEGQEDEAWDDATAAVVESQAS